MKRRRFLTGCAACAGAAGIGKAPVWLGAAHSLNGPGGAKSAGKVKIRVLYALHKEKQDQPDWPNVGYDFRPVMDRIDKELAARLPDFEFTRFLSTGAEQTKKIVADDKETDGYLVCQMNCWNQVAQTAATTGKPVLYADHQYAGSGGFLVYSAGFMRAGVKNVGFVASERMDDLVDAVRLFEPAKAAGPGFDFAAAAARVRIGRTAGKGDLSVLADRLASLSAAETVRRMKASKILAFRGADAAPASTMMEVPVQPVAFAELNAAWAEADKDKAKAIAGRWIKNAAVVEGVSRAEIENSAAMYLAEKAMLEKYGANAITINCLGGFYGGQIHAYPCLGFFELNNEGLIGACECDVRSTATMVALGAMSGGRPGYISDPVMETSKRRIIYAHCVASNKVFGPKGAANPYEILTHSEDRQGASVRSLFPAGYMTTTAEILPDAREILLHQAKAVGNDPDDRACRTKLVAEPVGDFEKLFREWDRWGWHRVTFFGDLKKPVYALAEAIGWKVVEEA
jgi:hypothetical protein